MSDQVISDELTTACLDFMLALSSDPTVSDELRADARSEYKRLKHLRPKE